MTAPARAVAGLSTKSRVFHLPAHITRASVTWAYVVWASVKMLLQLFFEA
jgi:hypothetical protein